MTGPCWPRALAAVVLCTATAAAQSGWQRKHVLISPWFDEVMVTGGWAEGWETRWIDPFRGTPMWWTSARSPAQPGQVRWFTGRGSDWRECPVAIPQGGLFVPLANDVQRRVVVALLLQHNSADTWEFDGTAWVHRGTLRVALSPLYLAAAHDSVRARTVLFSGLDVGARTFEWDGQVWQERSPIGRPPTHLLPRMAYDPVRQRSVLFLSTWSGPPNSELWEWDGNAWMQRSAATPLGDRTGPAIGWDPARQQVLVHGGLKFSQAPVYPETDTWAWDGTNWQLVTRLGPSLDGVEATFDFARGGFRMLGRGWSDPADPQLEEWLLGPSGWVLDARSRGLRAPIPGAPLCAERGAGGRLLTISVAWLRPSYATETWSWDGAWRQLRTAVSPPARGNAMLAAAPGSDLALLFGGTVPITNALLGDTWTWNGTTWNARSGPGPSPRTGAAMAYDAARGVTLLFGGQDASGLLSDTWSWNGTAWTQLPVGAPAARSHHAMAYDAVRARIVLFGGLTRHGANGETWEWDGAQWSMQNPPLAPAARHAAAMAADGSGGLLLFGGHDATGSLGDAWTWDGARWVALPPTGLPAARHLHGLAWHAGTRRLVLQGGQFTDRTGMPSLHGPYADTWVFGATVASAVAEYGTGCGGASVPGLRSFGHPVLGDPAFGLEVVRAPSRAPLVWLAGLHAADLPIGGACRLRLDPQALLLQIPGFADAAGVGFQRLGVPGDPALAGAVAYAQGFAFDLTRPQPVLHATAGLRLTLGD